MNTPTDRRDSELTPPHRYDDLSAVFINCTLKPSPEPSHTDHLIERSVAIMRGQGWPSPASGRRPRPRTRRLPDMTEHGAASDGWPSIQKLGDGRRHPGDRHPIWLGEKSSVCTRVIERLYGYSGVLNDAGWIGEAGPGPSYGDVIDGRDTPVDDDDFTNRNTTFMTWNLLRLARMLKDAGGIPAYGNQRTLWDAGTRFDGPNPEYR